MNVGGPLDLPVHVLCVIALCVILRAADIHSEFTRSTHPIVDSVRTAADEGHLQR